MIKAFFLAAKKILQIAVLCLSLFASAGTIQAEQGTFAIVSDTHVGTGNSVYPSVIRALDHQKIEMIIHTGDAVNKGGRRDQWEKFLQITGPDKKLHLAPGNHDLRRKGGPEECRRLFPRQYYSFAEDDTLFVILNTELPNEEGRIAGEQLAWLEKELDAPYQFKFVFLHEPPFPLVPFRGFDRHKEARDRLHTLFVEKGVSLVVAGHDHMYSRMEKEGVKYIIAPGLGGKMFLPRGKGFFRYIVANRMSDTYDFKVVDLRGKLRDHFSVAPSPMFVQAHESAVQ